jgi:hypothetical protein
VTVRDVIAALEAAYPPGLAESWDAGGLVCGDPAEPVRRVLVAVDPVAETVAEALEQDAQLLVTHHSLLLRGVHGVPTDDPKGALVHRLVARRWWTSRTGPASTRGASRPQQWSRRRSAVRSMSTFRTAAPISGRSARRGQLGGPCGERRSGRATPAA